MALGRRRHAITTDTITAAGALVHTYAADNVVRLVVSNVHSTNNGTVDVAVDVGGAGTTIAYILRNLVVPQGATISVPPFVVLNTDKLRIRGSAASTMEAYVSETDS